MSDDILDWLKMWANYPSVKATYGDKIHRAANEIERLRAENEKLRAIEGLAWEMFGALKKVYGMNAKSLPLEQRTYDYIEDLISAMEEHAAAALKGDGK